jgi:hypothetical protein
MAPVTTMQIYWGAVPYVVIQLIMVGLVIAFPQMVLVYKDDGPKVDPSKIEIIIPGTSYGTPAPPRFGFGAPPPATGPAPEGGAAPDEPAKSGDPLQDMLNQQQDGADKANEDLLNQLKQK